MGKNLIIAVLIAAVAGLAYLQWKPDSTAPQTTKTEAVTKDDSVVCAQVLTSARDPKTGAITEFPTPCDVPKDWEVIQNDVPGLDLEVQ